MNSIKISIYNIVWMVAVSMVVAVLLSGGMVAAQEVDTLTESDLSELDALLNDTDITDFNTDNFGDGVDESDFDYGLGEQGVSDGQDDYFDDDSAIDDLSDEELLNFYLQDSAGGYDNIDTLYDDEANNNLGTDILDSYEPLDAPQWDDVRALVEAQDESDVQWDTVLPDVETGELQLFGKESKALFGIFDIDVEVSRTLDADGVLGEISRPWYSFLLW